MDSFNCLVEARLLGANVGPCACGWVRIMLSNVKVVHSGPESINQQPRTKLAMLFRAAMPMANWHWCCSVVRHEQNDGHREKHHYINI
jgi:hypothetical protein